MSDEDFHWDYKEFSRGQDARLNGFPQKKMLKDSDKHKVNSFNAGWVDADAAWHESVGIE